MKKDDQDKNKAHLLDDDLSQVSGGAMYKNEEYLSVGIKKRKILGITIFEDIETGQHVRPEYAHAKVRNKLLYGKKN
jgi:hypothetical protein